MQTFFQLVSVIFAGTAFGIIFWTLLFFAFFVASNGGGGGFISLVPDEPIKVGLIIGAIHGFLVSIGVCVSKPGELLNGTLYGFVMVEIGFVIAAAYWFWRVWPPPDNSGYTSFFHFAQIILSWFVIYSLILIVPSVLLGFLTAKFYQSIALKFVANS